MNCAKRLFFIGIAVFETLTMVMGFFGGGVCIDSRPVSGQDFTAQCSRTTDGILVEVNCHGDDWTTFPDFKVNLTSVWQTKFINCSYAQNTSLLHIFRSMNINYSKEIQFEKLRSPLSRQNFQDLSVSVLTFADIDFTDLLFDMLYDVLGIETLNIHKTNLDRIPNNFFENWSRDVGTVDLMWNKLQKVAKNDFTHLPYVKELNLYQNEIAEIEAGAFDSLLSLKTLELGKNRLRTLPSGIFRRLSRLDTLYLGENPFDELAGDLLTSIQDCHLEDFRMNFIHGSLKTLPDGFFKNLGFLNVVQLENSQWETLPTDLFAGSTQLESLTLQNNLLKSLPRYFFMSFQKLTNLDLSNNQIVTLPAGIFEGLENLEDLNISYNNLTFLESDVLKGLGGLTKLNASHNNLAKVGDGLCRNLQSVQIIDFSFNRLTFGAPKSEDASGFEGCEALHTIRLSNNNFDKIIANFDSNLANIDLSFNNLSQLTTSDIENLRFVKTVDLRNNQISKINLMELASAVTIYKTYDNDLSFRPVQIALENNPLHCDCHLIDFVRYWHSEPDSEFRQYVKLTATNDTNDTRDLTCVSPLEFEKFNLSDIWPEDLYCNLKTDAADDACTNDCTCHEYPAKKVLSVDCSFKNLTQLPAMISNVYNWSIKLNISHNMLKQTPSLAILSLANVTILDLSHNNISTVTIDLFSKNLVDLKLHHNSISRLDETVIKYLADNDTLRAITLHQNPWVCDCEARRFLNFIQKKTSFYKLDGVVCHGTNRKLYKMTVGDVCKEAIAIIVGASLLVAFFGIVTGVVAALYYKYQREIKVWLYSKQWCLWFVTEDELDKDKKYDAFVSFSHKDEDFVENEIVAKLEDGPRPYKLCLHYRDWLAGEWIPVQISQSVEDSRRTIVVLSSNFLESVWARMEFRAAHTQALKEGRARVIIILYGEIKNMDNLDPELKSYLSLNTYVKWGDPWFWDKLRYALPHRFEPSRRRTRNTRLTEDRLVCQPVSCNNPNAIAESNAISMSKLANDSTKLLDSGVDERTTASC